MHRWLVYHGLGDFISSDAVIVIRIHQAQKHRIRAKATDRGTGCNPVCLVNFKNTSKALAVGDLQVFDATDPLKVNLFFNVHDAYQPSWMKISIELMLLIVGLSGTGVNDCNG